MSNHQKPMDRSYYLTATLEEHCLNGDAYVSEETLYTLCKNKMKNLPFSVFSNDLREQLIKNNLRREGRRIYVDRIWRCEESAAQNLSKLLFLPPLSVPVLPETMKVGKTTLTEEQRTAVGMALSNGLSVILGGAGCGKSTLIRAIVEQSKSRCFVVCAPTGKAARNVKDRTGLPARTVHSACGIGPSDDFLPPVQWTATNLVIVDEASMLSLELLAHLLCRAPSHCRVVLLGDPNQLPSVGAGNVIEDLIRLGFPHIELTTNHRQEEHNAALYKNVTEFGRLRFGRELTMDDSFRLVQVDDDELSGLVVEEAVKRYSRDESFQVLTTYNKSTDFSVRRLNPLIRNCVNPPTSDKPVISYGGRTFYDGDRVMITRNDRSIGCYNGDVGILVIQDVHRAKKLKQMGKGRTELVDVDVFSFTVALPDGRRPFWRDVEAKEALEDLLLAYVVTAHKSQGSQYDTILMPVSMQMQNMLSRNLFYTAISRATKQVLLFGSDQAVDVAMQRVLPPRRSVLVSKVQMRQLGVA